jgi:stress response protein YsnF
VKETKTVEVPVTHEEVSIKRGQPSGGQTPASKNLLLPRKKSKYQ